MKDRLPDLIASGHLSSDSFQWRKLGTATPGGQFVYRFYDADMRLLYVGTTWNPYARWMRHRRTQPWWAEVRYYDVHFCAGERAAQRWETWCIRHLDPLHNKMQNRRWHPRGKDTDREAGVLD